MGEYNNPISQNRYAYVWNNPNQYMDRSRNWSSLNGIVGATAGWKTGGIVGVVIGDRTGAVGGAISGYQAGSTTSSIEQVASSGFISGVVTGSAAGNATGTTLSNGGSAWWHKVQQRQQLFERSTIKE